MGVSFLGPVLMLAVHVGQPADEQPDPAHPVPGPPQEVADFPESMDQTLRQELRDARWTAEKAWEWYAEVGPIFGCNYLPRTAVNTTEMWQEETFDPETIDEELGWAAAAGYNGLRVFVQYLVWKNDPEGLKRRMEEFLAITDRHGMGVMFVPFCDCAFAGRGPYPGEQEEPVPGVHNSGWVPSPGHDRVNDPEAWPDLERYVKDLVGHFRADRRVLIWDLYNEPGMSGQGAKSLPLVVAAFRWAREAQPTQPLTVGAYTDLRDPMSHTMMGLSDVVSFHGYDAPEGVARKIAVCRRYDRPILCTEWLVRGRDNRFETILPLFAQDRVGGYHWGLVAGRTQTYMPWGSKEGDPMPELWHHDTFRPDGTPYDPDEIALIDDLLLSGVTVDEIVPTSEVEPQTWRYTTEIPNYGWHLPGFDPSAPWRGIVWDEGPGGFGTEQAPGAVFGTVWDTQNIWLRRTFELDTADLRRPHLRIRHDEHAEVYVNGHLAAKMSGSSPGYQLVPLSPRARAELRPGTNVISVHCHQTTGAQFLDVGLVDVRPGDGSPGLAMPEASTLPEPVSAGTPWPVERVRAWYESQPPIRGCNYLPRTAINSVEMWRKETFDPTTIHEELGWAAAAGYNSVRVFLQYVVWADDPEGFAARFETFLRIADGHGITTMPIFFDDVCFAMKLEPVLGPQDDPVFGIHNSGWVPSPGYSRVQDPGQWLGLEDFVQDVVGRHGRDSRVIVWDVYNEPGPYFDRTLSFPLARAAMGWVRELEPIQPVTVAVWGNPESRQFLALSDVLSLHTYSSGGLEEFFRDARETYGRPVLVTECLARPAFGFQTMLPLFARHHVGWYNWGLVAGRTQTNRAYASRKGDPRPTLWPYDVLRPDGTPYDARELELIRAFEFEDRSPYSAYLMASFGPEEKLYYSWSRDARRWTALHGGQPVFDAGVRLRDPFVQRADGRFHMVHTKGWDHPTLYHWESADLIEWTGGPIDVVPPERVRAWAPEFFFEESSGLFHLFWASIVDGHNTMHVVTTRDWTDITPERAQVFYDIGIHDIDLTVVEHDGLYYGFHKPGGVEDRMGNRLSVSRTLDPRTNTFAEGKPGKIVLEGETKPTEGPEVIQLIGQEKWYVYGDPFRSPMEAWETTDFVEFTRTEVETVPGSKHCSMLPITEAELQRLLEAYPDPYTNAYEAQRGITTLLPHAKKQRGTWRYTLQQPHADWIEADFDDSRWPSGPGGFGTRVTPNTAVGTVWNTQEIWLRRSFVVEGPVPGKIHLEIHHDEDAIVYLNGVQVAAVTSYNTDFALVAVPEEAAATLQPGENTIAVHCRQTIGGQYIDVGLVAVEQGH